LVQFDFYQKNNEIKLKKNKTEPKPGQTVGFDSVFWGKNQFKPVWPGFLSFGLVFSGFGSVFSVWLGFFPVSVRFNSVFCL